MGVRAGDAGPEGGVVPGDLLVPAGEACVLWRVSVEGTATVEDGGRLSLGAGGVEGDVTAGPAASVLLTDGTTVYGGIAGRGAEVRVDDSVVVGDVTLAERGGLVVHDSSFSGSLTGEVREWALAGSVVAGDVDLRSWVSGDLGTSYVAGSVTMRRGLQHVVQSAVQGHLTSDLAEQVRMCTSEVGGNLKVKNSRTDVVHVGASVGPLDACYDDGDNPLDVTVGGSAWFMDNRHSVLLGTLTVAGDLGCWGNTGPRGSCRRP
ncbi:hypothetical protein GC089_07960 [Cellulomonas sp. JZ18]|uniref:hypothetical protein n=1 Tax=Cellulomonas sp. JZ18 TaxID=2654191 RepID=UPI0012D39EDE|nr:hypothetical protein [Cellulomonas sp. JZ18]QGQ19177.1 hypothetical protein GC089_07960 [Cellulomonas sp. JZ18]